jgi:hypothetical protein
VGENKERFWAFMGGIAKQNESKINTVSALKNDIFGIDRAAVFGRPSGTRPHVVPEPGDKSPGYSHLSLRDEALRAVPRRGYSPQPRVLTLGTIHLRFHPDEGAADHKDQMPADSQQKRNEVSVLTMDKKFLKGRM